jgi:hypothetical protein
LRRHLRALRSQVRSWLRILFVGGLALTVGVYCDVRSASHPHGFDQHAVVVVGIVGLTVGAAMLASALVAGLVTRQVLGVKIRDLVEALRGSSPLVRKNQRLYIRIDRDDQRIHVSARHEFELESDSTFRRTLPVRIYTDVGIDGGFDKIVVDGRTLDRPELECEKLVQPRDGKAQFEEKYRFSPGRKRKFEIHTYGHFRLDDRLIWTVEQVSRDFAVSIIDTRKVPTVCKVKVNHHRSDEIDTEAWHPSHEGQYLKFDFLGEVLPYQGFELRWLDA